MCVNGTLVDDKMRRFKGGYAHFRFNKCLIYNREGANANCSTNSYETDYNVYKAGGIDFLHVDSIPGLLKRLKIRALSPSAVYTLSGI